MYLQKLVSAATLYESDGCLLSWRENGALAHQFGDRHHPEARNRVHERMGKMGRLYNVAFTFNAEDYVGEICSVGLQGEFLFYKSNLTGNTDATGMVDNEKKYLPSEYTPGLDSIGGLYYREMDKDASADRYTATLRLPAGVYPYGFVINGVVGVPVTDERMAWSNFMMDDGKWHNFTEKGERIPDPKNKPSAPTKTGPQLNSELYVGTSADYPWIPAENADIKGTVPM